MQSFQSQVSENTINSFNHDIQSHPRRISRRAKKRKSMKDVMAKYGTKGLEKIRSYDSYGTPIQLNYEGETTYKTLFGGILTIFFFVTLAF